MTDEQVLRAAEQAGELKLHSHDFDCLLCRTNRNYVQTKKFSPLTFVLAHLKSCRLRRLSPPNAP